MPAADDGAGMTLACCHPGHAAGEARDVDRREALHRRAIAQLTGAVGAPALHAATAGQRTRMTGTGGQPLDTPAEPDDVHGSRPRHLRAVSELSGVVHAPALHATARSQRAGVVLSGRDGHDAAAQAQDVRRLAATDIGAIAKLAGGVVAPALGSAASRHHAGELGACRDAARSSRLSGRHREQAGIRVTAAQPDIGHRHVSRTDRQPVGYGYDHLRG